MKTQLATLLTFLAAGLPSAATAQTRPAVTPNLILILCDNLGYGDIAPFGSTLHRTPNLDRMAREGMKLTHLYSASGVCTPSRAALMTGLYPRRVSLHMNATGGPVLHPVSPIGLNPDEVTVAEVLKERRYATGIIGKWHLGDQPEFFPTRQGFDSYWGVPYSDDMTPRPGSPNPPLPLMRNETVIEAPVDRNELTRRETEEAIRFIRQHKEHPFFLYIPQAMPGSTTAPFASAAFRGRSKNGPWGDSVEELDWSVGEILGALRREGLDDRTLVIWTSDNGAPRRDPVQGSNLPLGGWGYSTTEGGMRVPGIARWPKQIPAGSTSAELVTLMDMLPTFAFLAGANGGGPRPIDGKNIWPILAGQPDARSPHNAFYYYYLDQLQAVRSGPWKLCLPLSRRRTFGKVESVPLRLYDVVQDPAESHDVAAAHPDVVRSLEALAAEARRDIGDADRPGVGQRPPGRVAHPKPVVLQQAETGKQNQ